MNPVVLVVRPTALHVVRPTTMTSPATATVAVAAATVYTQEDDDMTEEE